MDLTFSTYGWYQAGMGLAMLAIVLSGGLGFVVAWHKQRRMERLLVQLDAEARAEYADRLAKEPIADPAPRGAVEVPEATRE